MRLSATQRFIERALEGGWKKGHWEFLGLVDRTEEPLARFSNLRTVGASVHSVSVASILLDPAAWQAVGKVEFWPDENPDPEDTGSYMPTWLLYMHGLIGALAEGKSVEEYLATIV